MLVLLLILLLLFGGGGWYGYGPRGGSIGLGTVLLIAVVLYLAGMLR